MVDGEADEAHNFLDDTGEPAHSTVPKKKTGFKPWHKPRKQWVREKQWRDQTNELLNNIDCQNGLSYLSLPGVDMLDVRVLHDLCAGRDIQMRFLGFNVISDDYTEKTEMELSQSEVSKLSHIEEESSDVILDRFENISDLNSNAYHRMKKYAPYGVINIDLCGSLDDDRHEQPHIHFETLYNLINIQRQKRTDPWILFVTTRTNPGRVHNRTLAAFLDRVKANCEECNNFKGQTASLLGAADAEQVTNLLDNYENILAPDFAKVFGLGFGKWLINLVMGARPHWEVTLLDSCFYQVQSPGDMASLAFRFDCHFEEMVDADGLAGPENAAPENNGRTELEQAHSILDGINAAINLDEELVANPDQFKEYQAQTRDLLENARYDPDAYDQWVDQGYPRVNQ